MVGVTAVKNIAHCDTGPSPEPCIILALIGRNVGLRRVKKNKNLKSLKIFREFSPGTSGR